jgi:hypothetical protein
VEDACEPLTTEWLELPWHEDQEKEAPGFDNHCADACLYAWRSTSSYTQPEIEPAEPTTTPEAVRKLAKAAKDKMLLARQKERERALKYGSKPITHQRRA